METEAPDRYRKTYAVSWDQFHRDARLLAARLLKLPPFKGILAIARGGLIPSAIIARELNIRLIETVCVSSYDWKSQCECVIGSVKDLPCADADAGADKAKGSGWLIIDDLVDTGRTAQAVRAIFPGAFFAALYAKPDGLPQVDMHITEVSQETWILFPWDSEVQYIKPLAHDPGPRP